MSPLRRAARHARHARHARLSLLVALLSLSGCDTEGIAPVDRVVRVGAALSLTGGLSTEGNEVLRGYELWAEWVNDELGGIDVGGVAHEVELIVVDDQSDAARAAALVAELIEDEDVHFLLGPYGSGATLTATAAAEELGRLMVVSAGASETIYARGFQNTFGVLTSAHSYTEAAIEALADLGATTVVIASEAGDAFSASMAEGAVDWADVHGLDVLANTTYPLGDVESLIEDAMALDPDVFIAGGHYEDALLLAETAEDLGFDPPAMLLTVGPAIPGFVTELGATAEGILGPTQWEPSMTWDGEWIGTPADYAALFEDRFGVAPSYQAAGATAAGLVLQAAIEAAGSLDTGAVRSALRALDVTTFYGPVRFDATGKNVAKPMGVIQVQDGATVVVAPPEVAVADLVYGGGG